MLSLRRDCQKLPRLTVFQVIQAGYWVKFSTSNDHASDEPHSYNIATAKECQRGSRPLPCTYVDVDRQGGNKLQTVTNSEGGPVPAMLPFARLPSAPRSSVQGLPLHAPNHLQHVMLNLVSVVLMRAAEKHSIQRPGTRRGGPASDRTA